MPCVIFYRRMSYHFLLYVMAPADPVDGSWEFLQGKGAGDDGRQRVSFMFLFDVSGGGGDADFVPYFVLRDSHGDLGGRPARETSASSFDGFISRSGGGTNFTSRPWRVPKELSVCFSFRRHSFVGATPSYAR